MSWNKPNLNSKTKVSLRRSRNMHPVVFGLIGAVVVIVGAVVARMILSSHHQQPNSTSSTSVKRIKEVAPAVVKTKDVSEAPRDETAEAQRPNPSNIVWVTERSYRKTLPDGKTVLYFVNDPNEVRKPALFKNGLNNFLTNYLVPGETVPETPTEFTDAEIMDAFMEKIEITDDDDEDASYKKESIALLREQLREYIKDGKTIRDFLRDLQNRQNLESEACTMARREILNSLADDDITTAKETYRKINEYMKSKGLPNVRLPYKYMKMMEEAE